MKRALFRWLLPLLLWLPASESHAVLCIWPICQCSVAATPVAFGDIYPLSPAATGSSSSVTVNCSAAVTLTVSWRVDLSAGGGSIAARHMARVGGGTLNYNLYTDPARSIVWGENEQGVSSSTTLDLFGYAPPTVLPVYARVPGSQTLVPPGSYSDTIQVTITFW